MLIDIPADAFEPYLDRTVARFAEDFAASAGVAPEEALARACRYVAELLPQGQRTVGQHFRHIVVDGDPVGTLWFAEQFDASPRRVFLFDIEVHEDHRGQGVGTTALQALEQEAQRLGAEEIMLAVFLHNTGAIRLYERLGFQPGESGQGGMRMSKPL